MDLIELRTRSDLLTHTGPDDAFARLDPADELQGWATAGSPGDAHGGAVAVVRASAFRPPSLFVWGEGVGAFLDALIAHDVPASRDLAGVSVPWPERNEVERRFVVTGGGDWDWMWTDEAPAISSAVPLIALDDTDDAAEIARLGRENPRFEGAPGQGYSERWLGVRDDAGRLIACGAIQRLPSGVAHLGGILVAADHRRRGLGATISAALTDDVVRGEGVCTLGMYSDNVGAGALYRGLGYRTDKQWASRAIGRRTPALGCGYGNL